MMAIADGVRLTPLDLIIILITMVVWGVAACARIYRQARFYQIEEYDSVRYLHWLAARPARWLPFRRDAEVKKPFRATARARRLLAAAFGVVIVGLLVIAAALVLAITLAYIRGAPALAIVAHGAGALVFLFSPLALIAGNVLMIPVEAAFRQRFIARARRVLEEVHPLTIGITGSYGKTSTKAYLAHLLNGRYKTYPTPKSYNTLMGVCLAINNDLANDHSVDVFVCEMGAYIPGEIERICDLVRPRIAIVTEVGPQHLERFGTVERVAVAKYEIVRALPPDGTAILNYDNPYIREMAARGYPAERIGVSRETDPAEAIAATANGDALVPRFIASAIDESLDGLRFTVTDAKSGEAAAFVIPIVGLHNVTNVLLALAVAVHEGMTLRELAMRARGLQPAESRLARQTTPSGITILNDAYSANPVGAVSALRVLSLYTTGRRVLVTPGMVELGDLMETENRRLGETAAQYATDILLVGARQTEPIRAGVMAAGFDADRVLTVETLAEALAWTRDNLRAGDAVLFLNDLPDTYSL